MPLCGRLTEPWFLMGEVMPAADQSTAGGAVASSLRELCLLALGAVTVALALEGSAPKCRWENSAKLRSVNWLGAAK